MALQYVLSCNFWRTDAEVVEVFRNSGEKCWEAEKKAKAVAAVFGFDFEAVVRAFVSVCVWREGTNKYHSNNNRMFSEPVWPSCKALGW